MKVLIFLGFAATTETTSGDALGEAGVRIAPHLFVFGDIGHFHNPQPSGTQAIVDNTTAALSMSSGLIVSGVARVPAWYGMSDESDRRGG
jgi:hypothetical protein